MEKQIYRYIVILKRHSIIVRMWCDSERSSV